VSKFRIYNDITLLWELLLYFKIVAGGQPNWSGVTDDAEPGGENAKRGLKWNGMVCKDQRCIHTEE